DWASGGLLTATLCPRPLACTAPAGGAGPGETHTDANSATGGSVRPRPVEGCRPLARTRAGSRCSVCWQTDPPGPFKNAAKSDRPPEGGDTSLPPEGRPSITGLPRS